MFENQVALVTGGSTGIGAATALHLARAGARVFITGRYEDTLRATAAQHPNVQFVIADVATPDGATRTIEIVESRLAGSTYSSTTPASRTLRRSRARLQNMCGSTSTRTSQA